MDLFMKIPVSIDPKDKDNMFSAKAFQMYQVDIKQGDIKVRHKFDRVFEKIFILEFESCLVKESVSRD